jgi:histidine ammonia-lyase
VDSIPTSANKEDHVSMGATAARKAARAVANTRRILAVELLAAAQALEFLRPLRTSPPLEAVHDLVRGAVAPWDEDRSPARDIEALAVLLRGGAVAEAASAACGGLE